MFWAAFSVNTPCPTSCTTRLISFTFAVFRTYTPTGRNARQLSQKRAGLRFVTSKPQNTVQAPSIVKFAPVALAPSSVARSPRYCRTTIGAAADPVRVLLNVPSYIPPPPPDRAPRRHFPLPPPQPRLKAPRP